MEKAQTGKASLSVHSVNKEALLLAEPWPFRVEDIPFAHNVLWHDEQDRIMPVVAARLLARALPRCAPTIYPDTGHLSTVVSHAFDIFSVLIVQV